MADLTLNKVCKALWGSRVFVICDLYFFRLYCDLSFEGMLCLVSLLPHAAWLLVEFYSLMIRVLKIKQTAP